MDVAHGEMVEKQLDALIQRRARKGEMDADEESAMWRESVEAYEEQRRQMALEGLIAHHEEQAVKLMDVRPKGA
jgi:hypothetical protein